jgi:hypothetical protein
MSDDPFEDLDADDREGDPFDHLDEDPDTPEDAVAPPEDTADGPESGLTSPGGGSPDPFEYIDDGPGIPDGTETDDRADAAGGPDGSRAVDAGPGSLGEADVSRGDPFESSDSPFEQVDVEGVDPDEVWERFTAEAEAEAHADTESPRDQHDRAVGGPGDDVVTVSKHSFCEGCPHFTAPPAVECTHEGTQIIEFVGPDEVRVSNCPIVVERRELGEAFD